MDFIYHFEDGGVTDAGGSTLLDGLMCLSSVHCASVRFFCVEAENKKEETQLLSIPLLQVNC